MGKVFFVFFVIVLIAFQHVVQANRKLQVDKEVKDNETETKAEAEAPKPETETPKNEAEAQKNEAYPPKPEAEVFEKDLDRAKDLIENDLKKKESNIKNLEAEVGKLTKSEKMLDELGDAYKKGENLAPFDKKLKKFNRRVIKKSQANGQYGSVIKNILKDLGLNRMA